MANWTNEPQPYGANHSPLLTGVSSVDGKTGVPVAVDPTTGALLTASSAGTSVSINDGVTTSRKATVGNLTNANPLAVEVVDGSGNQITSFINTQYTDGGAAVTHPTGDSIIYFNGSNVPTAVSSTNPLPITGTISVGSTIDDTAFTAGTSTTAPAAGVYNDSLTALTSGYQGTLRSTAYRGLHTNLRNSSGTEVGTSSNPIFINVANEDLIDSGNSTTTNLAGNASFTGTGHSTEGYAFITIIIYSNVSSATNGVQIQFSSDNINWDDASLFTFTSGGSAPNQGQTFGAPVRAQYYRVVYTNGASAQTSFRLQSIIKDHYTGGDMVTMTNVPNTTNHALLTKSSIVGFTTAGGGAFVDVKVNPSGALTTASTTQDAAGNSITSNSTTTSGTFGLDMNIRSILNTAPTTPGYLDIKGADGNVFVRQTTGTNLHTVTDSGSTTAVTQATAANLNATVVGTGTFAVQATGTVTANPPVVGTIYNGQKAVTGTAAAIATSQALTQGVTVEALSANTISVYVGASGVTTSTGIELPPGASITIPANNLSIVYVIASTTGASVSYIGV